ncbi:MAG: aquaporin, partial [bacterium]|nr:aquaporin [bacterium]
YLMEVIGTFFLTLAVAFSPENPVAIGLMFASLIYIGGQASGAHYNPAFRFAAWLRGMLKPDVMLMYIGAQTIGAVAALWLFKMYTGSVSMPSSPAQFGVAVLMETLLTFALVLAFLTVTLSRRFKDHPINGFVIGFTLIAIASIGGIFNPAIALAAMLFNLSGEATTAAISINWVVLYIFGPLLGGVIAAWSYGYFYPKD